LGRFFERRERKKRGNDLQNPWDFRGETLKKGIAHLKKNREYWNTAPKGEGEQTRIMQKSSFAQRNYQIFMKKKRIVRT